MATKKLYVLDAADLKALFADLRADIVADLRALTGPAAGDRYLSRRQVCDLLGIGLTALNSRIQDGTLQPHRVGKLVKFKASEIQNLKPKNDK